MKDDKISDDDLAGIQILAEEIAGTINDVWRHDHVGDVENHKKASVQLDELVTKAVNGWKEFVEPEECGRWSSKYDVECSQPVGHEGNHRTFAMIESKESEVGVPHTGYRVVEWK